MKMTFGKVKLHERVAHFYCSDHMVPLVRSRALWITSWIHLMSKKMAKFPIHLKEETKRSLRLFPIQCFWKSKHGISYYPHLPFSCDKLLQLRREEERSKSSSVLWAAWHIFRWCIKVPSIRASIFSDPEGFSNFLKLEWQLLQICIESSP